MANTEEGNQTTISDVILLGFGNLPKLQILFFLLFLVIYVISMVGNILIVVLVVTDWHLHSPMYFFLGNLSCLETCYSSAILPRLLASLLTGDRTISFRMCIMQYYFFAFLVSVECYLLSAMSYDRYLAICKPLHYAVLMNSRYCVQLAAGSWISGLLASSTLTSLISQLSFCGPNEVDHFLCDITPLKKLSCSDTSLVDLVTFILASVYTLPPFLLTLASYVCIITSILRVPSSTGRYKAFSTCSSHLIVVTLFYGSLIIVYVLPDNDTLRFFNKVFSVFYTILTPMVNPLIYSLRNREVIEAMRRATNTFLIFIGTEKIQSKGLCTLGKAQHC